MMIKYSLKAHACDMTDIDNDSVMKEKYAEAHWFCPTETSYKEDEIAVIYMMLTMKINAVSAQSKGWEYWKRCVEKLIKIIKKANLLQKNIDKIIN